MDHDATATRTSLDYAASIVHDNLWSGRCVTPGHCKVAIYIPSICVSDRHDLSIPGGRAAEWCWSGRMHDGGMSPSHRSCAASLRTVR